HLSRHMRKLYAISLLLAFVGAAILLYWWGIARPLWVDEEMLALNARDRGLLDIGTPLWLDQAAPLGWLMAERAAWSLFGAGERAMRALPVSFGIGSLAICVWIGRRWMTPLGAALLVLLCSMGQWIVFFNLELKHYSADVFWALFLPALAAWSIEGGRRPRRIVSWWILAATGLWFGNGALFVAPPCALVLVFECWRLFGSRFAIWTAAIGGLWLSSFALNYGLGLHHVL